VVEGLVEMYAGHAGRETTVSVVAPVGTFILAAVIRDAQHLQSARTLARSRLLMIPASSIREAIAADPLFAAAAMAQLAQEYRDVVRSLKGQKLRNGAERLANWLLQRSADGHATIEMPFEKRVLASLLGMTPENLSRAFKTLQPYGVCVDGTTITLADRADLMTLAKPDPLIDDPSV
ncbi:MAG: helix-turn-helix domain-containing protein, partial [Pseudomonadota bacterium]